MWIPGAGEDLFFCQRPLDSRPCGRDFLDKKLRCFYPSVWNGPIGRALDAQAVFLTGDFDSFLPSSSYFPSIDENIVWQICISNSRNLSDLRFLSLRLHIWRCLWQVDNCTSINLCIERMTSSYKCASGYLLLLSTVSRWVMEPSVSCKRVLITLSLSRLLLPANSLCGCIGSFV